MLKIARKYPILVTCAVIAAVCLSAAVIGAVFSQAGLVLYGFVGFNAACAVAVVVLSYNVFGGRPNSSIHGPGAGPDDALR